MVNEVLCNACVRQMQCWQQGGCEGLGRTVLDTLQLGLHREVARWQQSAQPQPFPLVFGERCALHTMENDRFRCAERPPCLYTWLKGALSCKPEEEVGDKQAACPLPLHLAERCIKL